MYRKKYKYLPVILVASVLSSVAISANEIAKDSIVTQRQTSVEVTATAEATILDVQIPLSVALNINPNQPYESAFTTPTLQITNNTHAPVTLSVVSMVADAGAPKVSEVSKYSSNSSEYNSWANLSVRDSGSYIAFGLKEKSGGSLNWKDPSYSFVPYWLKAEDLQVTHKIGDIKNLGTVQLEFMSEHGMAFKNLSNFKYDLMFRVDLCE